MLLLSEYLITARGKENSTGKCLLHEHEDVFKTPKTLVKSWVVHFDTVVLTLNE